MYVFGPVAMMYYYYSQGIVKLPIESKWVDLDCNEDKQLLVFQLKTSVKWNWVQIKNNQKWMKEH